MAQKFYWWEAEAFSYYRIPKVLITDPLYQKLSVEAALLYGLLLDRMGLSAKNKEKFTDRNGYVFVYFTLSEVCRSLNCGHDKATRLFCELELFGLIARVRQGKGNPCRIYVQKFQQTAG